MQVLTQNFTMSDPDLVLQWKLEILPKRRKTLPNQSILPLRIPQICNIRDGHLQCFEKLPRRKFGGFTIHQIDTKKLVNFHSL